MKCLHEITLCTFYQNSSDFPSCKAGEIIINLNFNKTHVLPVLFFGEYAIWLPFNITGDKLHLQYYCEVWTFLLDN